MTDETSDLRANDIAHWQTKLTSGDLRRLADTPRIAKIGVVSPGVVAVPRVELGFYGGFLVPDPDGHALQIVTPSNGRGERKLTMATKRKTSSVILDEVKPRVATKHLNRKSNANGA